MTSDSGRRGRIRGTQPRTSRPRDVSRSGDVRSREARAAARGSARTNRQPGVYRGPQEIESADLPAVQHGTRESFISWRMFSGLIVLSLCVVLFMFFSADAFYIHTVGVSGINYLEKEEIFRWADIADMHIFWVDPERVRQSIMRSPAIADVEVILGWPPNMVLLHIQEREPAVIWQQAGVDVWVDIHGYVLMQPPEERDNLVRVVARGQGADELLTPSDRIPTDVVTGALQLGELVPQGEQLRYDAMNGLGFEAENGADIWFGSGTDMPTKILVYQSIMADWAARGQLPSRVVVANPDAPYDCCIP